MNKPTISNDFSISDIHKIREFNAIERKRLGKENYNISLNRKVADFLNIDIEEIKNKNKSKIKIGATVEDLEDIKGE